MIFKYVSIDFLSLSNLYNTDSNKRKVWKTQRNEKCMLWFNWDNCTKEHKEFPSWVFECYSQIPCCLAFHFNYSPCYWIASQWWMQKLNQRKTHWIFFQNCTRSNQLILYWHNGHISVMHFSINYLFAKRAATRCKRIANIVYKVVW